jgi:hypothetical protein
MIRVVFAVLLAWSAGFATANAVAAAQPGRPYWMVLAGIDAVLGLGFVVAVFQKLRHV